MIENNHERWWESEVNRIGGEIALNSADQHAAKAEVYFDKSLAIRLTDMDLWCSIQTPIAGTGTTAADLSQQLPKI
jgi:hypothetical protein